MPLEPDAGISGRSDLVPVNSMTRHTTLDAQTMNHSQSCASAACAARTRTRSPAESMKLTADRSRNAVTPSARAASSAEPGDPPCSGRARRSSYEARPLERLDCNSEKRTGTHGNLELVIIGTSPSSESGRDPEELDGQVPLRLKLEGVVEHGSTGHALNLTDRPFARSFADSRSPLRDEIGATAQDEDALVRDEDVAEEGDVARVECVGRGGYGPRPKSSR